MKKVNIEDKNNESVYVGDIFLADIISPSIYPPTKVKVVEDTTQENIECGRNYDVEDEKGNRIWNAYMVIKYGERVIEVYAKEDKRNKYK